MTAVEVFALDSTSSGVLFWDGDGISLPDPKVELRFQPAGSVFGNSRPNSTVAFRMDLGVLSQDVLVCIPPTDVLAWADAIRAGGVS